MCSAHPGLAPLTPRGRLPSPKADHADIAQSPMAAPCRFMIQNNGLRQCCRQFFGVPKPAAADRDVITALAQRRSQNSHDAAMEN
jgi:hypothetical protein